MYTLAIERRVLDEGLRLVNSDLPFVILAINPMLHTKVSKIALLLKVLSIGSLLQLSPVLNC